ncbi:MAG: hypothetical protein AAF725_20025, partial [Acidobacteriota bacterium]
MPVAIEEAPGLDILSESLDEGSRGKGSLVTGSVGGIRVVEALAVLVVLQLSTGGVVMKPVNQTLHNNFWLMASWKTAAERHDFAQVL